jgi:hypothetical protein
MFESFKRAVIAHKNVVIAGVAVTALMGYIFPANMMQQVEGTNWWDDFVSNFQNAEIDDRDTNTQANFADVDQTQGNGDYGIQFSEVTQSNTLEDNDQNTIDQFLASWR